MLHRCGLPDDIGGCSLCPFIVPDLVACAGDAIATNTCGLTALVDGYYAPLDNLIVDLLNSANVQGYYRSFNAGLAYQLGG